MESPDEEEHQQPGRCLRWLRLMLGLATVPEICQASTGRRDYHDYKKAKGGDGVPAHFHEYTCWKCGKRFRI